MFNEQAHLIGAIRFNNFILSNVKVAYGIKPFYSSDGSIGSHQLYSFPSTWPALTLFSRKLNQLYFDWQAVIKITLYT